MGAKGSEWSEEKLARPQRLRRRLVGPPPDIYGAVGLDVDATKAASCPAATTTVSLPARAAGDQDNRGDLAVLAKIFLASWTLARNGRPSISPSHHEPRLRMTTQ
jgi:hypothetical protein